MAKNKEGRLSLTMPRATDAQTEKSIRSDEAPDPREKLSSKSGHNAPGEAHEELRQSEREQASSRSNSPTAPFSAASEQSKSPASPTSPVFTSLPPYPPSSPEKGSRHTKEPSRSFFQNFKASRSASRIQTIDPTIRPVQQEVPPPEETPKGPQRTKSTPELRETSSPDPVPDLPRLDHYDGSQTSLNSGTSGTHAIPRRPVGSTGPSSRSNTLQSTPDQAPPGPYNSAPDIGETKKQTGRLFSTFMRRNHHNRSEDNTPRSRSNNRSQSRPSDSTHGAKPPSRDQSANRGSDVEETMERPGSKSHMKVDGTGSHLFREFKQHAGRAAKEIGKSRGRFFRSRNSSNTQPPPDFANYELRVINQPLVEQTRLTRIAKRLEDSKDKTEFWMPALPWRCIDYLNFNGAEVEGLYRVPGSEREVRIWKARFDQEYDIDLFQEEELYDVNTIGSLFKSWLRDLPEDILPTSTQDELTNKYAGEPKAPEEVKEVLSQLPPWNYYLLFAITCHLSLLHAYQEKNKMTFHNLFVCFAPALRLNGDLFRWLVGDWRACWIGCATEKEALEEEYRILDFGGPEVIAEPNPPFIAQQDSSRKGSTASSVEATPRAEDFNRSQFLSQPPSTTPGSKHQTYSNGQASAPPQGRRPTNDSPHSRDGSRAVASREVRDSPQQRPEKLSVGTQHQRGNSQLPELEALQPISPTFMGNNKANSAK